MLCLTGSRGKILALLAAALCLALPNCKAETRLYGGLTTSSTSGSIYTMVPAEARTKSSLMPLSAKTENILVPPARFQMTAAELASLAKRHVVLLVDRSLSMKSTDCPGESTRWDWCCSQAAALARELSSISSDGICVVPFNGHFEIHDHQNAAQIADLFNELQPKGQTRLAPPLRSQLVTQLAREWGGNRPRPLLIAVITDGNVPDSAAVKRTIEDSARRLQRPSDAKILFLSVGRESKPCFSEFAGIPNVETAHFEDVVWFGLDRRLAQCLSR